VNTVRFSNRMTMHVLNTEPSSDLDSVEFEITEPVEAQVGAEFKCRITKVVRKVVEE